MKTHHQTARATRSHSAAPRGSHRKPARSKTAAMLAALSRPKGARLSELEAITGWQVRSIHAALTGFRHQGHAIVRETNGRGVTRYRVSGEGSE